MSDESKPVGTAMILRPKDAREHLKDMGRELYNKAVDAHNEGLTLTMASARLTQAATIFSDVGCEKFLAEVLREGTYDGGMPISSPGGDA